jgi:predicted nucleic acid-binding protein
VNVLVDTSIWSRALRRKAEHLNSTEESVVSELASLINEGRARIIGLVRQELLSGIRLASQYEKLRGVLRAFPDEPVTTDDYESAAKAGNQCRAQGVAINVSDMLICSIATSREWAVFTTDLDFNAYARILRLKLHTTRR